MMVFATEFSEDTEVMDFKMKKPINKGEQILWHKANSKVIWR